MKSSLIRTGTGNAVLRLILPAILGAGLATGCGPQTAQAPHSPQSPQWTQSPQSPLSSPAPQSPQGSLVGQWRTTLQSGTLNLTIEASGQYMQVGVPPNGGTQTAQGGPYALIAPNTIAFSVTDWSPKTRWIFVPNPRCGVPAVPNPTNPRRDSCSQQQEWTLPQPPGSKYAYTFNGPNTVILNNEQAQETITFTRVTGQ